MGCACECISICFLAEKIPCIYGFFYVIHRGGQEIRFEIVREEMGPLVENSVTFCGKNILQFLSKANIDDHLTVSKIVLGNPVPVTMAIWRHTQIPQMWYPVTLEICRGVQGRMWKRHMGQKTYGRLVASWGSSWRSV